MSLPQARTATTALKVTASSTSLRACSTLTWNFLCFTGNNFTPGYTSALNLFPFNVYPSVVWSRGAMVVIVCSLGMVISFTSGGRIAPVSALVTCGVVIRGSTAEVLDLDIAGRDAPAAVDAADGVAVDDRAVCPVGTTLGHVTLSRKNIAVGGRRSLGGCRPSFWPMAFVCAVAGNFTGSSMTLHGGSVGGSRRSSTLRHTVPRRAFETPAMLIGTFAAPPALASMIWIMKENMDSFLCNYAGHLVLQRMCSSATVSCTMDHVLMACVRYAKFI